MRAIVLAFLLSISGIASAQHHHGGGGFLGGGRGISLPGLPSFGGFRAPSINISTPRFTGGGGSTYSDRSYEPRGHYGGYERSYPSNYGYNNNYNYNYGGGYGGYGRSYPSYNYGNYYNGSNYYNNGYGYGYGGYRPPTYRPPIVVYQQPVYQRYQQRPVYYSRPIVTPAAVQAQPIDPYSLVEDSPAEQPVELSTYELAATRSLETGTGR